MTRSRSIASWGRPAVVAAVASTSARWPDGARRAGAEREARERNLRAYTELLRSDIRAQKVAVITEMMEFTEAEDVVFWPVYREYELALSRLYDERLVDRDLRGGVHEAHPAVADQVG